MEADFPGVALEAEAEEAGNLIGSEVIGLGRGGRHYRYHS